MTGDVHVHQPGYARITEYAVEDELGQMIDEDSVWMILSQRTVVSSGWHVSA